MAPLATFVKLCTGDDGEPILPEYAFALCTPGAWLFTSTMDLNILLEGYSAGDNLADNENPPEGRVNTESSTNANCNNKCHKHKGKSKTQSRSKSAGTASSTSEASPGCANQPPWINVELARQAAQDLHLSSDGSDSENPEAVYSTAQGMGGDSQPTENIA